MEQKNKNSSISYIARNIPLPGVAENPIILNVANKIKAFEIKVFYPKERFLFLIPNFSKKIYYLKKLKQYFFYEKFKIQVIPYLRLPKNKYSYILSERVSKKVIEKFKGSNLIHSHHVLPDGGIGKTISKAINVSHVISFRNGDLSKIESLKNKGVLYSKYLDILNSADFIVTHNHKCYNWLNNNISNNKIKLIPHGIEQKQDRSLNVKKEKVIVFAGSLIKRKNADWLIRLAGKVAEFKWQIKIIGDGPEYNNLLKSSFPLQNIKFLGSINKQDVLLEMGKAKIFALPSYNETFGVAYLEAALNDCCIVGLKDNGVDGWFMDGVNGIFVQDYLEFENRIIHLIQNEDYIQKLARNSKKLVKTLFNWKKVIDEYESLYTKCINSRNMHQESLPIS